MGSLGAPSEAPNGLVDLETELSCSICTDILYQPLTLLDCLHTFCGSCLKEWFGWQRQRADQEYERSHRLHRHRHRKPYNYTCPSCRAVVRETRPNATVTTLLDMYLSANPSRRKTEKDKQEIAKTYRPGDVVLVPAGEGHETTDGISSEDQHTDSTEEDDRRLLEQVQQLSVRDAGARGRSDGSEHTARRRNMRDETQRTEAQNTRHGHSRSQTRATQLGHQSSLRSLLSPYDSNEMKDEIMRQIAEEGLLDDIDWDNIQVEQEDEISERIAEAYRRRRNNGSRQRSRSGQTRSRSREQHRPGSAHHQARNASPAAPSAQRAVATSRPPVSNHRPHGTPQGRLRHHRRASSQGTNNTLRQDSSQDSIPPAARSATDLSGRPSSRDERHEQPTRTLHEHRRSTDPNRIPLSEQWRRGVPPSTAQPRPHDERRRASQPTGGRPSRNSLEGSPQPNHGQTFPPTNPHSRPSLSAPIPTMTVSCDRCGRHNIQNDLHYTCTQCGPPGSTYDLCLRCYRLGRGCLHWFGFGHSAWQRWKRKASPGAEPPHALRSQKYVKLSSPSQSTGDGNSTELALELGVFCDVCHENANSCYWHCPQCNDGEWGYCHRCVNQARHCSHPLLPMALQSSTPTIAPASSAPDPDIPNPPSPHSAMPTPTAQLQPLILPTTCNICTQSIPTTAQRLHCPECGHGDYDVCLSCYSRLEAIGAITPENGMNGMRKCSNGPNGHRMLLVDFAFAEGAQSYTWRRVLEGPVGGWSKELGAPAVSPGVARLNGGQTVGRAVAGWPWIPEYGVTDELSFPKGALIEEVVTVNDEISWGVYCREGGYLPSAYVRPI